MNYNNERLYLATMSIAKSMKENGLITEKEYNEIETMFAEKYGVSFGRLFTDTRLI